MNKLVTLSFLTLLVSASSPSTCDEALRDSCIGKLIEGYNFLKVYSVDGQGGQKQKVEYSYVFTKETSYTLNICTSGTGADGIVLTVFDSKRNKVASSKIGNNQAAVITYPCPATGIYYLQYTFENSTTFCGTSVLGFKRSG